MNWLLVLLMLAGVLSGQELNPDRRLEHAISALRVFLSPDGNVPKDLTGKAQCVVVVPRFFGGKNGRGFAACRKASGGWTAPAAIATEGSVPDGDLIMLVMNLDGMTKLVGGESPAEMISYSRVKGQFVGTPLEGATMRPDGAENKKLYGREVSNSDILSGKVVAPKGAIGFVGLLNKRARKGK